MNELTWSDRNGRSQSPKRALDAQGPRLQAGCDIRTQLQIHLRVFKEDTRRTRP